MKNLNIFVVKNILEANKPTDINEEIKRLLIHELDNNYGNSKTPASHQQILQTIN